MSASEATIPALGRSRAYRVLLHHAVVRRQALSGLLAQISQGTASVAIIIVVRADTRSLAFAGAAVGVLSIAAAIARPIQGRIIDGGGAKRLLTATGLIHAAALTGIVVICWVHGLSWLLLLLGIVAGLALPPISTSMRTTWPELVPSQERSACYSLVYLIQGLAILVGPLVFAVLTAALSASVALIVIAVLAGVGTLAFASTPGAMTRPPIGISTRSGSPLRVGALRALFVIALLVGAILGALQVGAATLAAAHHAPAVAGLLIGALSIGGIIGAATYGALHFRGGAWRRLVLLLVLYTAPLALMTTTPNLIVVASLMLLAGLAANPALSTCSVLLDQHIASGTRAEAFGWLSTALVAGTGGGNVLTAALAEHEPGPRAFAAAATAGAAAALLGLSTRRILDHCPVTEM